MKYSFRLLLILLILVVLVPNCNKSDANTSSECNKVKRNLFHDKNLQQIYTLQNQRNFQGLSIYLHDKNPLYRVTAAIACASLQTPQAIEPLALLLSDEKEEVRCAAAYALGQTEGRQIESILIHSWKKQTSASVKKNILESIGKCGTEKGLEFVTGLTNKKESPQILIGQAWGIYRFALHGIVSPKATALAVSFLIPSMPEKVRFIAAHYLARAKNIDLKPYAENMIKAYRLEKDISIRLALVTALGNIKDSSSQTLLVAIVKDKNRLDYRLIVNAIRALGNTASPEINRIVFSVLNHQNCHVAVTASEYFIKNGKVTEVEKYLRIAQSLQQWRVRANMLAAAMKYASQPEQKERISKEITSAYNTSLNIYEKAFLLKALAGDLSNYPFIIAQVLDRVNEEPVISTYGIDGLTEMCRAFRGDKVRLKALARFFKKAIETGDPALISYASTTLRVPELNFKSFFKDFGFLQKALDKCGLPDDLEGYLELRRTIDFFMGTKVSESPHSFNNRSIDWELVTSLPEGQIIGIHTTKGDINIRLLVNESPGSVANFVKLIKDNFFKGIRFHRVVANFVIQGGCPRGDGVGGPPYTIGSEFSPLYYGEGSVGMASAGKDTEGSQWFITHSPTPHLDGRYTIFARVESGMEVVHKIEMGDRILGFDFL